MTGESVETGAPCAEGERRICELFGEVGPCRFSGITEYRNRFGEPGLRGEVHSRVFLGGSWLYRVDTALGAVMVTAQNTGAAPVEEGSAVSLDWDAHSLRRLAA